METNMKRFAGFVLAVALLLSVTGCGSKTVDANAPIAAPAVEAVAPEPAAASDTVTGSETAAAPETDSAAVVSGESSLDARLQRVKDALDKAQDAAAEEDPADDMSGLESVAGLKDLAPFVDGSDDTRYYVDVDTDRNPYDLTWRYGNYAMEKDARGQRYEAYVDACDWSLVFDLEHYKTQFPMLALLYHDDPDLLLEHFQTAGVHEGRQGSEKFNVAAYMDHCSDAVKSAFGDDYACYYFYYMLNQETENAVDTENRNGGYRTWMAIQLTLEQQREFEAVNRYRAEVGVEPVVLDPEVVAFADYRAWLNASEGYRAHDWIDDQKDAVNHVMDLLDVDALVENTTAYYENTTAKSRLSSHASAYRTSKSHYEAMVDPRNVYFGASHVYRNLTGTGYLCEFDTFTRDRPRTSRTAD